MRKVNVEIEHLQIKFKGLDISQNRASRIFSLTSNILNSRLQARYIQDEFTNEQTSLRMDKLPLCSLMLGKHMSDGRIAERLADEILKSLTKAIS